MERPFFILILILSTKAQFQPFDATRRGQITASAPPTQPPSLIGVAQSTPVQTPNPPSLSDLQARLAQLEAENARLLAQNPCKNDWNMASLNSTQAQLNAELETCIKDMIRTRGHVPGYTNIDTATKDILAWRAANRRLLDQITTCQTDRYVEGDAINEITAKLNLANPRGMTQIAQENEALVLKVDAQIEYQNNMARSIENMRNKLLSNNDTIKGFEGQVNQAQARLDTANREAESCQFSDQRINTCRNDVNSARNEANGIKVRLSNSEKTNVSLVDTVAKLNGKYMELAMGVRA